MQQQNPRPQSGFTLIELMIVVAIVGILASIAIPAYSDYTVRAKVTEAVSAAGAIKTSVADYYYANGELPTSNAEAGLGETTEYATSIIQQISIQDGQTSGIEKGSIQVTFNDIDGAVSTGDTLIFIPNDSGSGLTWTCRAKASNLASLPDQYAPANCRGS